MEISKSINTCKNNVGYLLNKHPDLRDSDKLLWLAYLVNNQDLIKVLGITAYKKLKEIVLDGSTPTMESIRRIRQKYQESGQFVGKNRAKRLEQSNKVIDALNNF